MTLDHLVAHYGLLALLIGSGIEGEAVVVTGGILAHRGLFPLPGAMAAACVGSCLADQLFFAIGRWFRESRAARWARAKPAFARALRLLERHPIGFIFAFRFIYGMRTVSPFAIGTTSVPARTFVAVNIVAAIVWGCTFTLVGFYFGREFEALLRRVRPSGEVLAIAGVVAVLLVVSVLVIRAWLARKREAA